MSLTNHFTFVCLVSKPLNRCDAESDLRGVARQSMEVIAYGPPWDGILTTALCLRGPMVDVAASVENVEIL